MLERLADADAFRSMGLDRRAALWAVKGLDGGALHTRRQARDLGQQPADDWRPRGGTPATCSTRRRVALPETTLGEHVVHDYAAIGLSLKAHPVAFFREDLARRGVITSAEHWDERLQGRRVSVAGLVLVRQQPGTAKGVIFLTLEDETGIVNVVVWPKVFEKNRRMVMTAQFLEVRGRIEREGLVIHVIADQLIDRIRRAARARRRHRRPAQDRPGGARRLLEAQEPRFSLRGRELPAGPAARMPHTMNYDFIGRHFVVDHIGIGQRQRTSYGRLVGRRANEREICKEPDRAFDASINLPRTARALRRNMGNDLLQLSEGGRRIANSHTPRSRQKASISASGTNSPRCAWAFEF